jgi:hypothetical protein
MEGELYWPLLKVVNHHDEPHKNVYMDPRWHPQVFEWFRDEFVCSLDHI